MSLFSKSLLKLVDGKLVPRLAPLGFRVVEHEEGQAFDNALVILEGPELRLRVIRERGQLFVEFGSPAEPAVWFNSSVVMGLLSIGSKDGWHSTDADAVLSELAQFIYTNGSLLNGLFER